jgi:hypothetical protein
MDRQNMAFLIPEGVLVVDVEAHKGGLEQVDHLRDTHGIDIFKTFHTRTGKGGVHAYYKYEGKSRPAKGYLEQYDAIEIKGPGEMVTIPPAVSQEGKAYSFGSISMAKSYIKSVPAKARGMFFEQNKEAKSGRPKEKMEVRQGDTKLLKYLLNFLNPEEFRAHHEWVKIMLSCHDLAKGEKEGRDIFVEWCVSDEMYKDDAKKIKARWDATKEDDRKEKKITYRTLLFHAIKRGAKVDHNATKLVVEMLDSHFEFCSIKETQVQLVKFIDGGYNPLQNLEKRMIGDQAWHLLTNGAINVILGFIHHRSGIFQERFTTVKIQEICEKNKRSIFKYA